MAIKRLNLSLNEKIGRSLYEVLRDGLDRDLIEYSLVDSFRNYQSRNQPYPFVEKRELKPRARIPEREYQYQNSFLVLFYEGTLPSSDKKYIRFFDANKVARDNLASHLVDVEIHGDFYPNLKYFESYQFSQFCRSLLPVDYALLLQKDPTSRLKNRYLLSHFHVKIDWPIASAAEDMGKELGYLTRDLYERGEKYAEQVQQKLFECYGFHHTAGGRRAAAVVAAQFSRKLDFLSTVYVASSSSRTLTRIADGEISRYLLIKLNSEEMAQVAKANNMALDAFQNGFLIHREEDYGVAIFLITYERTIHSKPPADGKSRPLNPDYRWLTIACQLLIPKPSVADVRPVRYSVGYAV
ncbi:MAG: hypothetical protein AB1611_02660 [bacterium]